MAKNGLFFFFPFLKLFLKLGMQTIGAFYFGLAGLVLGAGAGFWLNRIPAEFTYSWQMCAVSGGLAGTFLGSLLALPYFKPMGARSDFMVWVRSLCSSVTFAFFSLPTAGFTAVFLTMVRSNHSIPKALVESFKQGMHNFKLMETPRGLILGALVFILAVGFRALLDALDGSEGTVQKK